MKTLFIIGALVALLMLGSLPVLAEDAVPPSPITPSGTLFSVNVGPNNQTDSHVSGKWVSYTDSSAFNSPPQGIHFQNLDGGSSTDQVIPKQAGFLDAWSDISGNQVVFTRDNGDEAHIYTSTIDASGNPGAQVEIAPISGSLRYMPTVGGGVIAFEDRSYGGTYASPPEMTLYDSGQAIRLTDDDAADRFADMSPDGSVVVWLKCPTTTTCDVWQARRANAWTPEQVTGSEGNEYAPHTDGEIIVYGSYRADGFHVYYRPVAGGTETKLALAGGQRNPTVSRKVISFDSSESGMGPFDVYAYDLSTEILYRISNTPTDARLSDISVDESGRAVVSWEEAKLGYPGDLNVYAFRFALLPRQSSLTVQPLFDNAHAHRAGSVVPLRIQILNGEGVNISSPDLVLTATGLVKKDDSSVTAVVDDAGNANPDSAFRYDASLQGYVYNLSTKGMAAGTWQGQFQVSGYSGTYTVEFDLR